MNFDEKDIKSIIKFGLWIGIPLIIGVLLLWGYSLYISLLKNINDISPNGSNQKNRVHYPKNDEKSKNIKRLSYLKYSHDKNNAESVYLIELVRIGSCKYIIVSKKNHDPTIIHASDCDNIHHHN